MTPGPVPAAGGLDGLSFVGRSAVRLAVVTVGVLVAAYVVVGAALAAGGQDAISDTWVGYLGGFALLGALGASAVAFAMALATRVRHRPVSGLWLPLTLLPALVLVVGAVELLWME